MFKNIFSHSHKPEISGIIGYLGLDSFWLSCTPDEQESLIRYYQNGLGNQLNDSPIKGKITFTTQTKLKYLSSMIGFAVSEKDYALADKIISSGQEVIINEDNILDAHYFWQESAECYYKQRDVRADALDLTIQFCLEDIKMFPKYKSLMQKEFGCIPRITTFQRLVILYERNSQYREAIDICNLAIKYNLTDSTKGGYPARLAKLEKKLK